jgi:adenosylcobinamide kinase/adenosylcobinamide-phosphate guanylyltransferase
MTDGSHFLPRLSLVTGGARSGKSAFAEGLMQRPATYIATAEARDVEMRLKVARHRERRGEGWTLLEVPHDLSAALDRVPPGPVLVDCATLWLSNRLLAGADLETECDALVAALADMRGPTVVVSNEVGWSVVPENALARQFVEAQGRLNQAIAAKAGLVVVVVSGLPMVLKGRLPIADADRS